MCSSDLDKVTGANNAEAIQGDPNKKLYNIDFDEPKNFFFGMTMEMNYVQPKDGKTGTGNKYDTVFEFAGDDDVWVYVDGTLLLDLSGIHRHVAAIQDDCIRKNPFDFQLNTVLEDTTVPKVPLTPAQEESLLAFVESDSVYEKYYDEIVILLGTGLRISELCGLTDADLDFEGRTITVDHQLLRSKETGYYIEKPKTESGVRQIPMSEKVYEALKRVLANRKGAKDIVVDGYSGFLFLNRDGNPKTAPNYDTMFRLLVKKYNKCHEEALPKVMTPHTLRHTFCTNLANAGMNPKACYEELPLFLNAATVAKVLGVSPSSG